jgi:hypothetical protein
MKISEFPLELVLLVEKTIQNHSSEYTKNKLWEKISNKMNYDDFLVILDYLEETGKIMFDTENCIIWTYNPTRINEITKENLFI